LGAITVLFVEEGTGGVRVSFSGTINLDPTTLTSFGTVSGEPTVVGFNSAVARPGNSSARITGGQGDFISSALGGGQSTTVDNEATGVFGFINDQLTFEAVHVSGGTITAPSQLTVSPLNASFFLPVSTASSLNLVGVGEGTVLWAAGGSATSPDNVFLFSSPSSIPEPSCVLLVALGGLGLMRRRR